MEEKSVNEKCVACGAILDDETAFRLSRAGHSYCCRCYLKHDVWGRPFEETGAAGHGYSFQAPVSAKNQ